jgi:tetratricopeptide (TPR) repeat protein
MPLRGDLDSIDLAHVFQMLVLNERPGLLDIHHEGAKRSVYYSSEGLRPRYERDLIGERVVRALLRAERVRPADVDRARLNVAATRKEMLETLVEIGVLSAADRDVEVRCQLEEDLYEMFFLRGGTFEFIEGEAPAGIAAPALALSVNGIVIEAARRVDEWQYIEQLVHSGTDIFERCGDLRAFDSREQTIEMREIHSALDGVTSIDELVEATGISRFLVLRNVAAMVDRGAAVEVSAETLVARANERLAAGDVRTAAACFEQAIARGVRDVAVHTALGRGYESLGQIAKAAHRYFEGGRIAEETGDLDSAIRLFVAVRRLLPTRLDARLRLFALRKIAVAHAGADTYDAESEGVELARVLHEVGRLEELRGVLAGMIEHAADNAAALERVADVAGVVGQPAFAVDALVIARDHHAARGDLESALHANRRAQALDPTHAELARAARSLQQSLFGRRDRRRTTIRAMAMIAAFSVIFTGYGRYSKAALDAYGTYSVEDCVASKDFAAGRRHYESIRSEYPLTVPFLLAAEKLREIEILEHHAREVDAFREQVENEKTATNLKKAKSLLDAAVDARHGGDYRSALNLLRQAEGLAGENDPLAIHDAIAALEEYLAGATRLATEAAFFRSAGRVPDAHLRLVELLDRFPASPEAHDLTLPVLVESDPPGARIRLDGSSLRPTGAATVLEAETPFVVDVPSDRGVDLELIGDGFAPYSLRLDGRATARVMVDLPRRPQFEVVMSHEVIASFAVTADSVFAPLSNGRVVALDRASLEVRWQHELAELAEVCAPIAIDGDRVLAPCTNRQIVVLGARDGVVRGAIELPEKSESAPIVNGEVLAVRCANGILAVGSATAQRLDAVALPSRATLGPIALPGERFAVACEDGRIWARSPDGTLSALRGADFPIGRITALESDATTIWIGDENGAFFVFDARDQQHRCSLRVFDGMPIDTISIDRDRPVVGTPGRIAMVDCRVNELVQTIDDGLTLVASSGDHVAAVGDDGTIRLYSRRDFSLVATYACGERLIPTGAVVGADGYFAAVGGRVLGVRIGAIH